MNTYRSDRDRLQQEIKEKQKTLAELEERQSLIDSGDPRGVADVLHTKLCHWNHTDGCGWYYESWDQQPLGFARGEYLQKAQIVIDFAAKHGVQVSPLLELITQL